MTLITLASGPERSGWPSGRWRWVPLLCPSHHRQQGEWQAITKAARVKDRACGAFTAKCIWWVISYLMKVPFISVDCLEPLAQSAPEFPGFVLVYRISGGELMHSCVDHICVMPWRDWCFLDKNDALNIDLHNSDCFWCLKAEEKGIEIKGSDHSKNTVCFAVTFLLLCSICWTENTEEGEWYM